MYCVQTMRFFTFMSLFYCSHERELACIMKTFEMCKDISIPNNFQHFAIKSENYDILSDTGYRPNTNCHLLLDARADPSILVLQFNDFEVELVKTCAYDSLDIAGRRYCGHWLKGKILKILVPPYKVVQFHFLSDYSISKTGFFITVDIMPYFDGETVSEYVGDGSRFTNQFIYAVYNWQRPRMNTYDKSQPITQDVQVDKNGLLGFLNAFPKADELNDDTGKPRSEFTVVEDGSKWFDVN